MKDSISSNQHLLKEKKKLKKSMLKEPKKLDLKRLRIKKEHLLKFKEKESRFLERCIKQERMSRSRRERGILLKTMPTLDLLCMLQLLEMDSLLIKKLTNMKFNQRLLVPTKVLRSFQDLFQTVFSNRRSVFKNSTSNSTVNSQEVKFLTCSN